MNYLIKLLKSCFAVAALRATWLAVDLACLSEEGVFYAFPGGCQGRCFRCKPDHISNRQLPDKPKVFTPYAPLVTLGVPGSGCVLYGLKAGLARAFLDWLY